MDRKPPAVILRPGEDDSDLIEADAAAGRASTRPPSPFLVQLIATRMGLAETRARRRAEPLVASERYRAMGLLPLVPPPGRKVARSA